MANPQIGDVEMSRPHIRDGKTGELWKVTSLPTIDDLHPSYAVWAILDGSKSTLESSRCVVCIEQGNSQGEIIRHNLEDLVSLQTLENYDNNIASWDMFKWERIGYVTGHLVDDVEPQERETLEI